MDFKTAKAQADFTLYSGWHEVDDYINCVVLRRFGALATIEMEYPVTKLETCELCGRMSTPFKVRHRHDIYGWDFTIKQGINGPSKYCLCVSCWNKVKPVFKKKEEVREVKRLIRHLNKERVKCQKSKPQRS